MKKKITAAAAALIMAASLASCAGSGNNTPDVSTTTTKSVTTKADKSSSDGDKKETTAADKKDSDGKKTTKKTTDTDSDTDSKKDKDKKKKDKDSVNSKETTITTISPKETMIETLALPDYDTEDKIMKDLGWTKEILEKYKKYKNDQNKFLKSLTFDEFLTVTKYSKSEGKALYDSLHGSADQGGSSGGGEQPQPELPDVSVDPGVKVDMTVDNDLKKVYSKFGVDLNYLLQITGLTKENFFYLWNNQKDQAFKDNVTNQLYGYNYYDNSSTPHSVIANKLDLQLKKAYWDNDGGLHVLVSMISGYPGLTYNIDLTNLEVHDGQKYKIAQMQVGALTKHAAINEEEGIKGSVEGISCGQEVQMEFVFDRYHVSKDYADIRSSQGVRIEYTIECAHYDPSEADQQLMVQ